MSKDWGGNRGGEGEPRTFFRGKKRPGGGGGRGGGGRGSEVTESFFAMAWSLDKKHIGAQEECTFCINLLADSVMDFKMEG